MFNGTFDATGGRFTLHDTGHNLSSHGGHQPFAEVGEGIGSDRETALGAGITHTSPVALRKGNGYYRVCPVY